MGNSDLVVSLEQLEEMALDSGITGVLMPILLTVRLALGGWW